MRRGYLLGITALLLATGPGLSGQTALGTFRWQLQPYCNVLTVTVVQDGGLYHIDGTDDLCGAARKASVVGLAFPNPDGTVGFGLTTVTTPGGTPVHLDARISVATLSGPWSDSAGNSGTGAVTPGAGTITAAQLAPGAINAAAAAFGTCPAGQYLRGLLASGTVLCEPIGTPPVSVSPDTANSVGYYTSIAIGTDGLPVISHLDTTTLDLRVTHCSNIACTAATSTTVDDPANIVGIYPSQALGTDGLPVISHNDATAQALRVTKCASRTCQ